MFWILVTIILSVTLPSSYGYICACVYSAEQIVYISNSTASDILGRMFEFDCKPTVYNNTEDHWMAIMFQHQIGYIEMSNATEIRNCKGDLPDTDKITLPAPTNVVTVVNTQAPTYTVIVNTVETVASTYTATSAISTTTPPITIIQGHMDLCPPRIQNLATLTGVTLGQYGHSCYEVVKGAVSWQHAEQKCVHDGGHLAHIANQLEQDFIHTFLVSHHSGIVWIGYHDQNAEEHFQWSSGDVHNYTNWSPTRYTTKHDTEDCVFMSADTGLWDDVECGVNLPILEILGSSHNYICQFDTIDRSPDGDISLCSDVSRLHAVSSGGNLGQYGNSCYELVKQRETWATSEALCVANGGHLAHINNVDEQAFLQGFMRRHSPSNDAWIGLTDSATEGTFTWASGDPVVYSNWLNGHVGNHGSSGKEDCVIFSPYHNGKWDDLPCGQTTGGFLIFNLGSSYTYQSICQYDIIGSTSGGMQIIG